MQTLAQCRQMERLWTCCAVGPHLRTRLWDVLVYHSSNGSRPANAACLRAPPLVSCAQTLCAASYACGSAGVSHTEHLRTNGSRDVGARGHGVAIAQNLILARGQVVEISRTGAASRLCPVRRDQPTSSFFGADFFCWYPAMVNRVNADGSCDVDHEDVRVLNTYSEFAPVDSSGTLARVR